MVDAQPFECRQLRFPRRQPILSLIAVGEGAQGLPGALDGFPAGLGWAMASPQAALEAGQLALVEPSQRLAPPVEEVVDRLLEFGHAGPGGLHHIAEPGPAGDLAIAYRGHIAEAVTLAHLMMEGGVVAGGQQLEHPAAAWAGVDSSHLEHYRALLALRGQPGRAARFHDGGRRRWSIRRRCQHLGEALCIAHGLLRAEPAAGPAEQAWGRLPAGGAALQLAQQGPGEQAWRWLTRVRIAGGHRPGD